MSLQRYSFANHSLSGFRRLKQGFRTHTRCEYRPERSAASLTRFRLEIIRVRYGKTAHILYMGLCLVNNIVSVTNMLLGASAVVSALTGMQCVVRCCEARKLSRSASL